MLVLAIIAQVKTQLAFGLLRPLKTEWRGYRSIVYSPRSDYNYFSKPRVDRNSVMAVADGGGTQLTHIAVNSTWCVEGLVSTVVAVFIRTLFDAFYFGLRNQMRSSSF